MQILSKYVGSNYKEQLLLRDLSEISSGGRGGGNRGRVTTFRDSEKGGVIKNGPLKGGGSCK